MSVKVAFHEVGGAVSTASRTVTVPKAALQQHNGRDVVWIVQDGRAERRAITLGLTNGDEAVVNAGLAAGERVVVKVPAGLTDGARVKETKS